MAAMVPRGGTSIKAERFRGSLARSVLLLLLLLSLLPAAIISSVNYFRSRQLLHDQTGAQLETIIQSQSQALNQLCQSRSSRSRPAFQSTGYHYKFSYPDITTQ